MYNARSNYDRLEESLNYSFNNKELLIRALTHSSYLNEHQDEESFFTDNETLEFLGDAVLELAITKYLYDHCQPKENEGQLSLLRSNLVSEPTLAILADKLMINEYIRMSKGEYKNNGHKRESILSDALEAVFGAIYLDSSYNVVESKILDLYNKFDKFKLNHLEGKDFKSRLQESIQSEDSSKIIEYRLVKEIGPEHSKTFYTHVYIDHKLHGAGKGSTKKSSEQMAAKEALNKINK